MPIKTKNKINYFYGIFVFLVFLFLPAIASAQNSKCSIVTIDTFRPSCEINNLTGATGLLESPKPSETNACGPDFIAAAQVLGTKCCCPPDVIAANAGTTNPAKEFAPLNPLDNLQVEIPGLAKLSEENAANCSTDENNNTECQLPFIPLYIKAWYNYAMMIIGILATVALCIGGLIWLISSGNASRVTEAKAYITASITGLLITVSSYIILNEINPDLISFSPTEIKIVDDFMENSSDSIANLDGAPGDGSCPKVAELTNITSIVSLNGVSSPYLKADAANALKQAVQIAKNKGVELLVTSAFRSPEKQRSLWNEALAKYKDPAVARKYCAPPSTKCYSHLAGTTVDLCIKGSASCGHMGFKLKANATYSDADTKKVQEIMKEAGWIRYCGEWWHFQFNDSPKVACSP